MRINKLFLAYLIISILLPIGGLLIVLLLESKIFTKTKKEFSIEMEPGITEYSFFPDVDVASESDVIAFEDALELSDLHYRRKIVLDVLKRDVDKYHDFLNKAIRNEDSETTHYAASSILDNKRKMDLQLNEATKLYHENSTDHKAIMNYAYALERQIKAPYLNKQMKKIFVNESIKVLKNIVDNNISIEEKYIINLLELLLEEKEYKDVYYYCNEFIYKYPYTEGKYLTLLRCYYTMEDYESFKTILLRANEDNISLSKDVMSIIRFWLGGNP